VIKRILPGLAFILVTQAPAPASFGNLPGGLPAPLPLKQEGKADLAIARGLAYLVSQQDADGALHTQWANRTAMTSLGIMALAAVGHQPTDDTREGRAMKRAIGYVLRPELQDHEGYFGNHDGSRMYGHGITTLMLAELLGMGADTQQDRAISERCQKAIDLILRAQAVGKGEHDRGGWRYTPDSYDSDLSATIWQVMALRAAKNAGIEVPKGAIDQAIDYIKRCYYSSRGSDGKPTEPKSAFAYGVGGRAPVYSTAAAGILALQMCGNYSGLEVTASAEWLRDHRPEPGVQWFYYGTYYYAQGFYQLGGEYAVRARKEVEQVLLVQQRPDGSWVGQAREYEIGPVYATSLAVLSLAVKYHYLPIYQR
jgi:hypothetical protein